MYPKALEDLDGDSLNGKNKYVIHFDADKIPPVDAFWSVTMYNSKFLLVENEIDRYNIGDRTPGLKYNDDGSLDILIQYEAPEDTSNWLPAPEDGFYLINRLYNPQEPALTGEWIPSGVEKKNLSDSQSTQTTTTEDDRPNILVIVLDDVGFSDLGFTASEINTPS